MNEFCDAFLAGEAEKIEQMLGDYLWNMISVRDNAVKEKKKTFIMVCGEIKGRWNENNPVLWYCLL